MYYYIMFTHVNQMETSRLDLQRSQTNNVKARKFKDVRVEVKLTVVFKIPQPFGESKCFCSQDTLPNLFHHLVSTRPVDYDLHQQGPH